VENPKIRVLIADDEAHIRALLGAIISRLGGEVVPRLNGDLAMPANRAKRRWRQRQGQTRI
jgi:CheY-like chemotaxis protein